MGCVNQMYLGGNKISDSGQTHKPILILIVNWEFPIPRELTFEICAVFK